MPTSAEQAIYLDSSAIVKLVVTEAQTAALRAHLPPDATLISSALARSEVARAVMPQGPSASAAAARVLERFELLAISEDVLRRAGEQQPAAMRTLDAIHLCSAMALEAAATEFVCYDRRLAAAARDQGFVVTAPA